MLLANRHEPATVILMMASSIQEIHVTTDLKGLFQHFAFVLHGISLVTV